MPPSTMAWLDGTTPRRSAGGRKKSGGRLMTQFGKLVLRGATVSMLAPVWAGGGGAEPVKIVAIGSSNTNGVGVGASNAWPAHLQQMLKKKGYDITMSVSAINGETTNATVGRAPGAIPPGTKIVIYQL